MHIYVAYAVEHPPVSLVREQGSISKTYEYSKWQYLFTIHAETDTLLKKSIFHFEITKYYLFIS